MRITISTDNPEEFQRVRNHLAEKYIITKLNGPKRGQKWLNWYVFVKEQATNTSCFAKEKPDKPP